MITTSGDNYPGTFVAECVCVCVRVHAHSAQMLVVSFREWERQKDLEEGILFFLMTKWSLTNTDASEIIKVWL